VRQGRLAVLFATVAAAFVAASGAGAQHSQTAVVACKTGYYLNVSGHCVHSPSTSAAGATARCRDGTYSYSEHASGTCSHHGGVSRWIHRP
jgi:hypothetical protein